MVSKITIFEAHLDGAQFGPVSPGQDEKERDDSSREDDATETSGGRSRVRIALLGVALVGSLLAIAVAVRRLRSDSGSDDLDDLEVAKHTDKEEIDEEERTEERTVGAIE